MNRVYRHKSYGGRRRWGPTATGPPAARGHTHPKGGPAPLGADGHRPTGSALPHTRKGGRRRWGPTAFCSTVTQRCSTRASHLVRCQAVSPSRAWTRSDRASHHHTWLRSATIANLYRTGLSGQQLPQERPLGPSSSPDRERARDRARQAGISLRWRRSDIAPCG